MGNLRCISAANEDVRDIADIDLSNGIDVVKGKLASRDKNTFASVTVSGRIEGKS